MVFESVINQFSELNLVTAYRVYVEVLILSLSTRPTLGTGHFYDTRNTNNLEFVSHELTYFDNKPISTSNHWI